MDLSLTPLRGAEGTLKKNKNAFWTDSSFKSNSPQELSPTRRKEDSEDDIPLIPDIDELQDDDYYGNIAAAPEVPSTNLSSYVQLNSDLKKYAAFSVVDSVNLGLLSKHLFKETELKEADQDWTWDLLFTEVSSELRSEWDKSNANPDDD